MQDNDFDFSKITSQFCITLADIEKFASKKLSEELVFENDKYKFVITLKTKNIFSIARYFNVILQTIKLDDFKTENKFTLIANILPKLFDVLLSEKMEEIFLQTIQNNKVIEKKDGENITLNQEDKNKLTIDDIFTEDLTLYTKMCVALLIITLKTLFFSATK